MSKPFLFFWLLIPHLLLAQTETVISGKIQDKHTKETLPYVSIGFKDAPGGTTSNFEGYFKITTTHKVDTLLVSYVGYKTFAVKIHPGLNLNLVLELEEITTEIGEVLIRPGINPALRIIDAARDRRKYNNQDRLEYYQYDSYSKVDISLTNISEEMKNSKVFKPLNSLFDTIHQMRNDEGKHILPVFVSETFSKYYYTANPGKSKEVIEGSRYSGIGVETNSYITDLLGGELHHFNFSNNYITILNKDLVSPIADVAHFYYIYTLIDSSEIDGIKCYKIQLNLKRKHDLGFEGLIWIADSSFALKRLNIEIGKNANINFVNRIKIHQEQMPSSQGPWITVKSRLSFEFDHFKKNGSGVLAGFYNAYTNVETEKKMPATFFDLHTNTLNDAWSKDSSYWNDKRTEVMSSIETEMFNKIDSVNNLPVVKTYVDIVSTIVEGYKRIGKLDWGPYLNFVSGNQVEGLRLRLGFKTNYDFSEQFVIRTHIAYGFKDDAFKYSLGIEYYINPRRWTVLSARYRHDYDILGITNSPITMNTGNFFQIFNFFGNKIRMNLTEEINLGFARNISSSWSAKFVFDNSKFTPLGNFIFAYKTNPSDPSSVSNTFTYSQLGVDARFAYREVMISRGHDRITVESAHFPVLTFSYRRGIKGLLNGNFNFDRIGLIINHHMNTSVFGTADWWIYTGKVFGVLPYPLLDVARGNESNIYSDFNYSLMNFYEFISDAYIHSSYTQHLEGLFFNKIPYVNNLKLRNALIVKAAYGSLSAANKILIPALDTQGRTVLAPKGFNHEPYVEVGYSIENILKFGSVGFTHRLNYHNPGARLWGFNFGIRVQF